MQEELIDFHKLNILTKNKKIILYGVGLVARKFIQKFDNAKIAYLIDNNKTLWNTKFEGFEIKPIKFLEKEKLENNIILICTTSFMDVISSLKENNKIKIKFFINPLLNEIARINSIENFEGDILISSGLQSKNESLAGGGVYKVTIKKDKWNIKKLYNGTTHGLIKYKNNYVLSDSTYGLLMVDKNFKILKRAKYDLNTRAHGVAYNNTCESFFIACSMQDKIYRFDKNLKKIKEYKISKKFDSIKSPQHHLNDIATIGNSIFISMFSYSGNHKKNIYDGVVLEIDIDTGEKIGCIYSDLWMPHSIKYFDDSFYCLDSLKGNLLRGSKEILGTFPGFTRGLDLKENLFFIGQSKNRNFSKVISVSNNSSLDTSIIIFNPDYKVSRSIFLPPSISEIHEVLCI